VAEKGLVKGKRIGIDASTMEANAALRTIVRRDDGRTYREMLTQMAKESGLETPSADDLVRIDRTRKGKKLSNDEWISRTDPEAKIAKLKDGRTHLAYKPEHAVDLDTGVIVAAAIHPADNGDTTTIAGTLASAENNLAQIDAAPTQDEPSELVADKGYHSRVVLKDLNGGAWKTRIAEPKQPGFSRWRGDDKARAAVYANRIRLGSGVGKKAMRRRAEIVERSFAHNLDRGGMRRTWLRGRENVHKRYLVHVAGHNLGILMRLLIGAGTPREAVVCGRAYLLFVYTEDAVAVILVAAARDGLAILVMAITADPGRSKRDFSNGLLRLQTREAFHLPQQQTSPGLSVVGVLYRPRLVRHLVRAYAALAAGGSCSARMAAGGRKPCRSMSQVVL
jgi:transposase